jgi:hypothetical protein
VILPSGEFRPLARSNSVTTPRVGRSAQKARKRVRYDPARPMAAMAAAAGAAAMASGEEAAGSQHEHSSDAPREAWSSPEEGPRPSARSRGGKSVERGGASDVHRR